MSASSGHWDGVYATKKAEEVSWYQPSPDRSLAFIERAGLAPDAPIIDVGAGASLLVDRLLALGHRDITLLDVSAQALTVTRERLGDRARDVAFIACDVTAFVPARQWALWHDRAVFHFLVDDQTRALYKQVVLRALAPGGHVVLATFADDGPERCSGLPVRRHTPEALAAFFAPELALVHAERERHVTPWGAEQRFVWVHLSVAAAKSPVFPAP